MAESEREVGAAVPFGALCGIGLVATRPEEQQFPPRLQVRMFSGNGIVFAFAGDLTGGRVMKYA